jgi:hypothetical protein
MIRDTGHRTARAKGAVLAAPAGGAHPLWWGWGCALAVCVGLSQPVSASAAEPLDVPSGQLVYLGEILRDDAPDGLWLRFRFLAPSIGVNAGQIGYDVSAGDMDHLCQHIALPYVFEHGLSPERVVISFSDRVIAFGTAAPEATQFFEAYRVEANACVWEEF